MITLFSESKNRRIFKRILLTFSNIMNSSKEMMLYYWIDIEFNDIEFIDIKYRDLLSNIIYIYDVLEVDNWSISSSSCEWRDI